MTYLMNISIFIIYMFMHITHIQTYWFYISIFYILIIVVNIIRNYNLNIFELEVYKVTT